MKSSNRELLDRTISSIFNSENSEMVAEKEHLQKTNLDLKKQISLLKDQLSEEQQKSYATKKFEIFYYTHFGICPQCNWEGWFEDWQGGGESCDLCLGEGDLKLEEIREYILQQFKKTEEPL